jgi:hypothetical protein
VKCPRAKDLKPENFMKVIDILKGTHTLIICPFGTFISMEAYSRPVFQELSLGYKF